LENIIRVTESRRVRWTRYIECKGEMRNTYRILDSNPERKRPLGRPRHRFEDNIRNYLKEVGYENMNWVVLTQDMDER
jgi:hypothetical protein